MCISSTLNLCCLPLYLPSIWLWLHLLYVHMAHVCMWAPLMHRYKWGNVKISQQHTAQVLMPNSICASYSCMVTSRQPAMSTCFVIARGRRFAERHRRLLNTYVRRSPGLLEGSMAPLLRAAKLIEFDNKRVRDTLCLLGVTGSLRLFLPCLALPCLVLLVLSQRPGVWWMCAPCARLAQPSCVAVPAYC